MGEKSRKPDLKLQAWIDARTRHRLTHSQVQMARELGLNPKNLGKIDNHGQEPWKLPLCEHIERLYLRSFRKARPDCVLSIEELHRLREEKKARKRQAKSRSRGPHELHDEDGTG